MLIIAKGTVLVTIGTKDGFILAADSRQTSGPRVISDKKQKIYRISKYVAFSFTGRTLGFGEKGGLKAEYDLHQEVTSYAANETAPTVKHHAEQLAKRLYEKIAPFYAKFPSKLEDWLRKAVGRDSFITLHIMGYEDKRMPRWFRVNFPPKGRIEAGVFRLAPPNRPEPIPFKRFGMLPDGWSNVIVSLRNKDGTDYPDCRKLEPLRKYYTRSTGDTENTTVEEGIQLAQTLVDCTIRHSPHDAGVGGEIQMAVVERKKGFRWVRRLADDWA